MFHVGLTGGIGCGKSTIAAHFTRLGVAVIDADEVAREVVKPGTPGLSGLRAQFGDAILQLDGRLNRAALRQQIFDNPQQRQQVEELLHPLIADLMLQQAAACDTPYLIFMIPLLTGKEGRYPIDRILVVDLPEPLQLERVMQRDQITREAATAILQAQLSRQQRLEIADETILNIDTEGVAQQVEQLHQLYLQLSAIE
jgi:dephospho-CoA kinase